MLIGARCSRNEPHFQFNTQAARHPCTPWRNSANTLSSPQKTDRNFLVERIRQNDVGIEDGILDALQVMFEIMLGIHNQVFDKHLQICLCRCFCC